MIIKSLDMVGFKCFKRQTGVALARGPGLYHVTGRNEAEPALGANGAGKSTIWDALTWAFFGKTPRGLKAGNVANWELGSGVSVVVVFERDGNRYRLSRTWSPNTLNLTTNDDAPRPVQQDELERVLGLDVDTWHHAVVIGQFTTHFLDLTPTERLALFSRAMNLDVWLKASEEAKKSVRNWTGTRNEWALAAERLCGQIDVLTRAITASVAAQDDWESQRAGRAVAAQRAAATARERLAAVTEAGTKAKAALNRAKGEAQRVVAESSANSTRETDARIQVSRAQDRVVDGVARLDDAEKALAKYNRLGPTCSLCKQVVDRAHAAKHVAELTGAVTTAREAVAALRAAEAAASKAYADLKRAGETCNVRLNDTMRAEKQADDEVRRLGNEWRVVNAEITRLEAEADAIGKETNPIHARLKREREELERLRGKLEEAEKQGDEAQAQLANAEYWVSGFKDVRLWLVTRTLEQLEVEANNSMRQLGMEGWSIRFEVEAENKSGGVSRGFLVFIQSPGTDSAVPWEAWSGGESQRLRVATAAGLANLIRAVRGVHCNIEVWDEPTAHLSGEGIEQLLEFLNDRSRAEQRCVWLVDHRSLDFGGFAGQITVVKDGNGSKCQDTASF